MLNRHHHLVARDGHHDYLAIPEITEDIARCPALNLAQHFGPTEYSRRRGIACTIAQPADQIRPNAAWSSTHPVNAPTRDQPVRGSPAHPAAPSGTPPVRALVACRCARLIVESTPTSQVISPVASARVW
jgi:hypothetical protein